MAIPTVPTGNPHSDFITAPEAAGLLGVNRYTFYRWIKRGYVPHHRFGRIIRVSMRDLRAFIERAHSLPIGLSSPEGGRPQPPAG